MLATFHRQAWERLRINPVGKCGRPQTDKAVRAGRTSGPRANPMRLAVRYCTDFGFLKACSSNAQGLHSTVFGSHLTEKEELKVLFLSKSKIVGHLQHRKIVREL
jgi:hypothetical protein